MPIEHRQFLVSFEKGTPQWPRLGLPGIEEFPAILWRQRNLDTLDAAKRDYLVDNLEKVLWS